MSCPIKQPRLVKRGMSGSDVLGYKYGLKKAGVGKSVVLSKSFRLGMYLAVRKFQSKHGLKVDGQIGQKTYAALRKFMPAYGCWLLNHYKAPQSDKRSVIVRTALYGAAHSGQIHYTQGPLRMQGVRQKLRPPAFPRYEDCSSYSTWCYWVAGMPDPNGRGYDGYGYTGTLTQRGWRVSAPNPGDLVFYGGSSSAPYHVAIYIGGGQVVSHGSESGPLVLSVHYRDDLNHYRRYPSG